MWLIFFISLILMFFSLFFFFINLLFSKKTFIKREKNSPFECGFDPLINTRLPFSMHFFLISLIFLIFDIEITLLIPLIIMYFQFNKFMIISCSFFLIILIFGLFFEYFDDSLDWKL